MTPQPNESGISVPGTSTHFLEPAVAGRAIHRHLPSLISARARWSEVPDAVA